MNFLNWLSSQKYRVILLNTTSGHSPGEVLEVVNFGVRSYSAILVEVRTVGKLEGTTGYVEISDGSSWRCPVESLSLPINLKNVSREITPGFIKELLAEKDSEPAVVYKDKKLQLQKLVAIFMGVSIGDSLTIFRFEGDLYIAKLPRGLGELGAQLQSDYTLNVDLNHVFGHNDKFTVAFGNSLEATNYGNITGFKLIKEETADTAVHPGISGMPSFEDPGVPVAPSDYYDDDDDDDDDDGYFEEE